MEFPELETDRLKLVQVYEDHTHSFFDIMSNAEVTKYYGMDSLKSMEEASKIIEFFKRSFESNRGIRWAIILKETNDFIGTVGLNNLSLHTKKADLGFELHPSHWNKGIMTEAAKPVLRYSFEELALYRVGAVTFPQNASSIQLLKRLGFSQEGLLRGYLYQNNSTHDASMFSLIRTEWV